MTTRRQSELSRGDLELVVGALMVAARSHHATRGERQRMLRLVKLFDALLKVENEGLLRRRERRELQLERRLARVMPVVDHREAYEWHLILSRPSAEGEQ
jgi:hypothetical protein